MNQNLFHDIRSADELEKILVRHPKKSLLPVMGSPEWKHARQNPTVVALAEPLRKRALAECGQPFPALTDELYASFRATGCRLPFEEVYFERRRQLGRAVITLLLAAPGDPLIVPMTLSMLEKFTGIFEEVSWALPAHVNWHNDDVSGKEPMQIDLFCAETANLMAEMLDLFGDAIPANLQARVRERLRSHIWENYAQNFEAFHWTKVTHNWNAVCHQGVLGSALSQVENAGLLARMLWLARRSLSLFLDGFTKDGGCSEGIGYWSYGFGWFADLNKQLEERSGGELSIFEGDEHVRRIAQFGPRMALAGGNLVNFSDNGAKGTLSGPLLAYLGERLDEIDCTRGAVQSFRHVGGVGVDADAQRCDARELTRLFLAFPNHLAEGEEPPVADCFLPDLVVIVARGRDAGGRAWDFAAKAGHNDEHHNHNDCANFILNVAGVRFAAEIGAPEYDRDFFGPKRYENLAARSLGHSVPLINGAEQAAGASFASKALIHTLDTDLVEFVVDATAAYPAAASCRKFVRTLRFEKAGHLQVHDVFELDRTDSLEGAFIAIHPVIIEKNHALIRSGELELIVRPLLGTRLDRVEVLRYSSPYGNEAFIHRLVYKPEFLASECAMAIDVELSRSS